MGASPGRLAWAHVACTRWLTHFVIHPKRCSEATDAIGILPTCTGVSVHDGWKPYQTQTQCRHALCNIHHLRELTFLEEQYQQGWATELKRLLREMKAATERACQQGRHQLDPSVRDAFIACYDALIPPGLAANPPPIRGPRRRGRIKQTPTRNLLERLLLSKEHVLAFLDDLAIPFGNNHAEGDQRMLKVQQKVSGGFRAATGSDAFARIRGYLSTLSKQEQPLLPALAVLFTGKPCRLKFA